MELCMIILISTVISCASETNNEYALETINLIQPTEKRLNLNGTVLRIASINREPYQTVQLVDGKYVGGGFSFEIMNEMAKYFNFSYEIVIPEFEGYGKKDKNGKWMGLIGTLVNKEADIAATPFSISKERKRVIDFSSKLFKDSLSILIKLPDRDNSGTLLAPFHTYVWITIVILSTLMGPILYIIQQIQHHIIVTRDNPKEKNVYNLIECVWFIYCGLMKQGSDLSPTYDSTRIFFSTWWIFTLVLTTFYTANLTACLSLHTYSVEKTLNEVLESERLKWVALDGTILSTKTLNGTGSMFSSLKKSFKRNRGMFVTSDEEALQLISTGGYAYFQDSLHLDHITQNGLKQESQCIFSKTGYKFLSTSHAFAFQKNYRYSEEFNKFLLTLRRTGLIRKWMMQYLIPIKSCSLSSTTGFSAEQTALSLHNTKSAFVAYVSGMGFSIFLFLVEKLWHKRRAFIKRRVCRRHVAWYRHRDILQF